MYGFTLDHLGMTSGTASTSVTSHRAAAAGTSRQAATCSPAPTARQCTAVLTGVLIRHGIPLTGSLTADLTAVVVSREAALLEYLAARARTRVEQVLVHSVRAEAFRDGLQRRHLVEARRHCRGPPRRGRHRRCNGRCNGRASPGQRPRSPTATPRLSGSCQPE